MTLTKNRAQWLTAAATLAIAGLIAGLTIGFTSYRAAQRQLDSFTGVAIPGTMSLRVDQPTGQVVYYEVGDPTVRYDDLSISVRSPEGSAVDVEPYRGELVYEKLDHTEGRAVATFAASRAGDYKIHVTGVTTGRLVVGDSYVRRALPGLLTGLVIATSSVVSGLALWLTTSSRRLGKRNGPTRC